MSGPQQLERSIRGVGVDECSMPQFASQREIHAVIAHHSDANSGLVSVCNLTERGARRHQIGEVCLQIGGREVHLNGPTRADPKIRDVARTRLEALDGLGGTCLFNEQELYPEARGKCTCKLYSGPLQLTSRTVLAIEERGEQSNSNLAGLHQIRNSPVALLRFGGGRTR